MTFRARTEQCLPAVVAVLTSAVCAYVEDSRIRDAIAQLAGPVVSLLAISIGFVSASVTILVTSDRLPTMKALEGMPTMVKRLVGFHSSAVVNSVVGSALTLGLLLAFGDTQAHGHARVLRVLFQLWVFLVVLSIGSLLRVLYVLKAIIRKDLTSQQG